MNIDRLSCLSALEAARPSTADIMGRLGGVSVRIDFIVAAAAPAAVLMRSAAGSEHLHRKFDAMVFN